MEKKIPATSLEKLLIIYFRGEGGDSCPGLPHCLSVKNLRNPELSYYILLVLKAKAARKK